MPEAGIHDGHTIDIQVQGSGPTVLMPVNPRPVDGPQADEMRQWGADPSLGHTLVTGLGDAFRVVAFDYEGHVLRTPKPDTLTPANVAHDVLAVADAVGADRFAYYGYSWLAAIGLQLAIRTDRLSALVMGGFPPLGGPYAEMLRVTTAAHELAVEAERSPQPAEAPQAGDWSSVSVSMSDAQTRQFVTLYRALQDFDDRAAQSRIACPRLCFVGSVDEMEYGEKWGNVHVNLARPIVERFAELDALGWEVRVLDGLDHMQAMQATQVLPILRPWLVSQLAPT